VHQAADMTMRNVQGGQAILLRSRAT